MGSSCTLPAREKVAMPSRIVRIEHSQIFMKNNRNNTSSNLLHKLSTKIDSFSPSVTIKANNSEAQTAIDLDEEPKCGTSQSIPAKYSVSELGIGENFLEKEFSERPSKKSKTKKKLQARTEAMWDKMVVQMREKVSVVFRENSLYNTVDLCLKEFELTKPKIYKKILNEELPRRYRWSVWKNLLDPERFYVKGLYERLKNLSSPYEHDIKKDVHRTFPDEPYFASKEYDNIGQKQLFSTLKAVSLYFPNVGYVQGLNFLMGFLLMLSGGNELDSFWIFVTLFRDNKHLMMGFFEKDFPLIEFYLYVFYQILQEELPLVYKHVKEQQFPDQLWVFKWFLTVFVHSVPQSHSVRIWDFIIESGIFGVVQVAIGILKHFAKDIAQADAAGMDQFLRHLRGENRNKDKLKQTNGVSSIENVDMENGEHETLEPQYSFKEVNIEAVLKTATKVVLTQEKVAHLAEEFTQTVANSRFPDFYKKYLKGLSNYDGSYQNQSSFQEEVEYYIMKSELCKKPSEEIVISNLNEVNHVNLVVNDLVGV